MKATKEWREVEMVGWQERLLGWQGTKRKSAGRGMAGTNIYKRYEDIKYKYKNANINTIYTNTNNIFSVSMTKLGGHPLSPLS